MPTRTARHGHWGPEGSPIRQGADADFRARTLRLGCRPQPRPIRPSRPPLAANWRANHRTATHLSQWAAAPPSQARAARPPAAAETLGAARDGSGRSQRARSRRSRAAAVRARCPRALPRERARRGCHRDADARGRHSVRQRLPPAARSARARCGRAARARVRRPGRGPVGAPGAHLRRHGGRGARRRRLPRLLQERPQPLGRSVHRLPHAAPWSQSGARLPGGHFPAVAWRRDFRGRAHPLRGGASGKGAYPARRTAQALPLLSHSCRR